MAYVYCVYCGTCRVATSLGKLVTLSRDLERVTPHFGGVHPFDRATTLATLEAFAIRHRSHGIAVVPFDVLIDVPDVEWIIGDSAQSQLLRDVPAEVDEAADERDAARTLRTLGSEPRTQS